MMMMIDIRDLFPSNNQRLSGSVAEWLAFWTETQEGLRSNRSRNAVG